MRHRKAYYYGANSDSKIERGDKEESMEAYFVVRRDDDDADNKVI